MILITLIRLSRHCWCDTRRCVGFKESFSCWYRDLLAEEGSVDIEEMIHQILFSMRVSESAVDKVIERK